MLVKKGKVEIMSVIEDEEHNLDDEGTRKVLDKAAENVKKQKLTKSSSDTDTVEN